jgi:2-desacetyl-2-hydroxyethyl bacteriochlorophyllide A dehydrogenase
MKQLICQSPGHFEYREVLEPTAAVGHSILRVKKIGVCGTDIHAFEGDQPFFSYPRVLGHELACEFIEGDKAIGFKNGDLVTLIPYLNCGTCLACRRGMTNCCALLQVMGVHIDGGMQEYISVPSYLLVHGEELSSDHLAMMEPLAIGAHGIARADIKPGEFVLVIGAGPIGLGAMAFAKIVGGHVIAVDTNETRLAFCRDQLHIPYSLNPNSCQIIESLMEITNGDMPSVVIDATGRLDAINQAFHYLSHTGKYILIGLQKDEIHFSHPEFHKREATLMSSRNAVRKDLEYVMDRMQDGHIDPLPFITSRLSFEKAATGLKETTSRPDNIKTIIEFQ